MSPEVLKQFLVRQGRWLTSSHQSRLCLQESMDANTALKARLTLLKGYRLLKVAYLIYIPQLSAVFTFKLCF